MVIGTEHVDAQVEAALALVEVVGDVTGDVRRIAITLDDNAVLVITEVARTQPGRAILLVDVAGLTQLRDGLLHPSRGVHRVLMGENVEVRAELVQRLLDVGEHQVHADFPKDFGSLGLRQRERIGTPSKDLLGDIGDVIAGVPVLGSFLALGRGDERADKPVDLRAMVVEVVLAGDLGALAGQQAAQRVADRSPPGASDVNRPRRVGRDELQVDGVRALRVGIAVVLARVQDVRDDGALRVGGDPQVHEPGSGNLRGSDRVVGDEGFDEPGGQVTRGDADLLGDLQGHVGGVVTVLGVTGAFDGHGVR